MVSNEDGRQVLRDLEKAEELPSTNWDDPEDVAEYRRKQRQVFREQHIPHDRKCPSCGLVVANLRSWVLSAGKPICRSCFHSNSKKKGRSRVDAKIFSDPELRFPVNRAALISARQIAGLSKSEFAKKAGWSRSWQQKLENGSAKTVSEETVDVIMEVLSEHGVSTLDFK